jgi:hypothetical protein
MIDKRPLVGNLCLRDLGLPPAFSVAVAFTFGLNWVPAHPSWRQGLVAE